MSTSGEEENSYSYVSTLPALPPAQPLPPPPSSRAPTSSSSSEPQAQPGNVVYNSDSEDDDDDVGALDAAAAANYKRISTVIQQKNSDRQPPNTPIKRITRSSNTWGAGSTIYQKATATCAVDEKTLVAIMNKYTINSINTIPDSDLECSKTALDSMLVNNNYILPHKNYYRLYGDITNKIAIMHKTESEV